MPVKYILSSVWVRLSIFSQLSIIQYMGLCVFSLPISLVMIERIYTLSYYHHQIGSMNYYPLFRVRSWNNGMCCMSLYILISSDNGLLPSLCGYWHYQVLRYPKRSLPTWLLSPSTHYYDVISTGVLNPGSSKFCSTVVSSQYQAKIKAPY